MKRSTLTSLLAALVLTAGLAACSEESDTPVSDGATENSGQTSAASSQSTPAAGDVSVSDLMAEGALPDIALGAENAPVTIVEYASLTCPHCAVFQTQTFPALKQNYIDSGKVRYIFREFPLDNYATAGFMLARCSDQSKYYPIIDAFFAQQRAFLDAADPFQWIQAFGKEVGFTQESLDACLSNQDLLDNVMAVRQRASEKFGVSSTPSFFINGKIRRGSMTIEELSKEIDPLLKS
ncbi:thioredoxin domain-containing protein [Terrihabitans sp. B22-R8]|uniref:thioredoxin domain-containing protein n=1 Tax=Terrihabitans sp. B22-R8 TaxID=3425128 RepID=UPI00403C3E83